MQSVVSMIVDLPSMADAFSSAHCEDRGWRCYRPDPSALPC
jgi:hypothetical protein